MSTLVKWRDLKNLAARSKAEGDYPKAIEHLSDALRPAAEANPLDIALMNNGLADLYLRVGDSVAAEQPARESLRIELEFGDAGRETTHLADYYIMMSRVLKAQHRFGEAADCVSQAVPIFSDLLGADNSYTEDVRRYQKELEEDRWRG